MYSRVIDRVPSPLDATKGGGGVYKGSTLIVVLEERAGNIVQPSIVAEGTWTTTSAARTSEFGSKSTSSVNGSTVSDKHVDTWQVTEIASMTRNGVVLHKENVYRPERIRLVSRCVARIEGSRVVLTEIGHSSHFYWHFSSQFVTA